MKRIGSAIFMAGAGLLVGVFSSAALLAFAPQCGYDCESNRVGFFVLTEISCFALFLLIGYLAFRKSAPTIRQLLTVCGVASLVVLVPSWANYVWNLQSRYRQLEAEQSPKPSVDFAHMVIATRAVPTATVDSSVESRQKIAPWARCLVGTVDCMGKPRRAQMLCKGGVEYVDEEHWNAFTPIPTENLAGISPLPSMKDLCTAPP